MDVSINNYCKTYIRSSTSTRWFTLGKISKLTLCFLLNGVTILLHSVNKHFLQIDLLIHQDTSFHEKEETIKFYFILCHRFAIFLALLKGIFALDSKQRSLHDSFILG